MHELVARLIAADQLQGLRLDHIDGLLDPAQYTRRLQQLIRHVRGGERRKPFYVVVEKILADGEAMPAFPGVAGTTGYEWLNTISRVLVDQAGRERLDALWREIAPGAGGFRRGARKRQAPRARHHHGERIQRAGATAQPHRRRPFQHARLFGRPAARGAAALCSRISALPHLRDGGGLLATTTAPSSSAPSPRRGGAGRAPTPTSSISCATRSRSISSATACPTAGRGCATSR